MTKPPRVPFAIELAVSTHLGAHLPHHHDQGGKWIETATSGLVVVASGTSTTEGAELASTRAVATVLRSFRELARGHQPIERLARATRNANYELRETALTVPRLGGISTTLTAVSVRGGLMSAAHVGNGRVYLVRDGGIVQLSKDHTLAAEAGVAGEAGLRPTRQLGPELVIPIDLFELELVEGDTVVACTDGLHRLLGDERILENVLEGNAISACHRLIKEARRMGTPAHLSAGVVTMVGPTPG